MTKTKMYPVRPGMFFKKLGTAMVVGLAATASLFGLSTAYAKFPDAGTSPPTLVTALVADKAVLGVHDKAAVRTLSHETSDVHLTNAVTLGGKYTMTGDDTAATTLPAFGIRGARELVSEDNYGKISAGLISIGAHTIAQPGTFQKKNRIDGIVGFGSFAA